MTINQTRGDLVEDRFARMRWFVTKYGQSAQKYYPHTEFVIMYETLQNFYAL